MPATETVTVLLSADPGEWMRLAVEALNPDKPEPEPLTCESCKATDADAYFTKLEADETNGDDVCDECLPAHAAQAADDERHRLAYLYG